MGLDVPQASSSQLWLNQILYIENGADGKLYLCNDHDHEFWDLKKSLILEGISLILIIEKLKELSCF